MPETEDNLSTIRLCPTVADVWMTCGGGLIAPRYLSPQEVKDVYAWLKEIMG